MIIVVKAGKWIAKHRFIILLLGILLLIPSFIGMAKTRINYDLLSYLPESLETVEGQDVMVDEYGMGAFAMVVVEDTDMKDIQNSLIRLIMSKKYYGMVMWQIFHCR